MQRYISVVFYALAILTLAILDMIIASIRSNQNYIVAAIIPGFMVASLFSLLRKQVGLLLALTYILGIALLIFAHLWLHDFPNATLSNSLLRVCGLALVVSPLIRLMGKSSTLHPH